MSPYVVTLALEDAAQRRLDEERERWFPAGRTQVGAHVTLFHAVPGERDVDEDLTDAADRAAFRVAVTGVVSLGRGVAHRLASDALGEVHALLRGRWLDDLTPQDRQPFRPHVTVQNKVTADVARETLAHLAAGFTAYDVGAVGLDLWRYEGGPWAPVERYEFRSPQSGTPT